jgi:hypothetical protein
MGMESCRSCESTPPGGGGGGGEGVIASQGAENNKAWHYVSQNNWWWMVRYKMVGDGAVQNGRGWCGTKWWRMLRYKMVADGAVSVDEIKALRSCRDKYTCVNPLCLLKRNHTLGQRCGLGTLRALGPRQGWEHIPSLSITTVLMIIDS